MKKEGLKTKSWNFEEGRRRPNHLRKVLKRLCLQLNSVVINWVLFAYVRRKLLER